MRPLIEIQTIPIEIQMKTTNAHLEYARGTAQMEVSRDRRGLQIRSQPIRVNIDTFEARSSIAVSYTHLDVYKRQARRRPSGRDKPAD